MSKKNHLLGFTLLEIMAVLVLIGILMSIMHQWINSTAKAKENIHQTNILMIEEGAHLYRIDVGIYPETIDDLLIRPPGKNSWNGPYLKARPVNPFDRDAVYTIDLNGKVRITKE